MDDDAELLRRYIRSGSETAFAELVRRHLALVYFTALRRTGGDAALAQDVAQSVFSTVARKAGALANHATLTGWLYTTTRHLADRAARNERTRHRYEQHAAMHELMTAETSHEWERLRPIIDDSLDALSQSEREAILVRFFEGRAFAEMGAMLRISEDAARMRVDRALEKLRAGLARKGIPSASAALALVLSTQGGLAAPTGMAATVTGAAMAAAAGTTGAVVLLGFMSAAKLSIAAAVVAAILATGFGVAERNRAVRAEAKLDLAIEEQATLTARLSRAKDGMSQAAIRAAEADKDSARLLTAIEAAQPKPRPQAPGDSLPAVLPSSKVDDRLSRRLSILFPDGVVATIGGRTITVADIQQKMAPLLARLQTDASNPAEFDQKLDSLQNSIVKASVERILLIDEFNIPGEEESQRVIPPEYVDNALADILNNKFANDSAKFSAYLGSRDITQDQYRKELQEEIEYRYMANQQRKLNQNEAR